MKQILLVLVVFATVSCNFLKNSNQKAQFTGSLAEFCKESNNLIQEKYNLEEHNKEFVLVSELKDEKAKEKIVADFEVAHKAIITEISNKYPAGTLNLPMEQNDKSGLSINRLYISEYMFPWSIATRMSYKVNFDCIVHQKKDMLLVRFEFFDTDGDLFMTSNTSVFKSGTYTFEIHPEVEFYHFEKVIVTVN